MSIRDSSCPQLLPSMHAVRLAPPPNAGRAAHRQHLSQSTEAKAHLPTCPPHPPTHPLGHPPTHKPPAQHTPAQPTLPSTPRGPVWYVWSWTTANPSSQRPSNTHTHNPSPYILSKQPWSRLTSVHIPDLAGDGLRLPPVHRGQDPAGVHQDRRLQDGGEECLGQGK